jgi:hypothetical protein
LSDALSATWARPQLADLLLIKRVDAITPANDERKMGDDMDTVSTQEVQELLHSRALERRQPQSANTMYAVPPQQSGWHFSPQERWHAPPPPPPAPAPAPVIAAPVASHAMAVVDAGATASATDTEDREGEEQNEAEEEGGNTAEEEDGNTAEEEEGNTAEEEDGNSAEVVVEESNHED